MFFVQTLPSLAIHSIIKPGGMIILPLMGYVRRALDELYEEKLSTHYALSYISNPFENPLYKATEDAELELLLCPEPLVNDSQMRELCNDTPFVVLHRLVA